MIEKHKRHNIAAQHFYSEYCPKLEDLGYYLKISTQNSDSKLFGSKLENTIQAHICFFSEKVLGESSVQQIQDVLPKEYSCFIDGEKMTFKVLVCLEKYKSEYSAAKHQYAFEGGISFV